jgi:hypothetical protein
MRPRSSGYAETTWHGDAGCSFARYEERKKIWDRRERERYLSFETQGEITRMDRE